MHDIESFEVKTIRAISRVVHICLHGIKQCEIFGSSAATEDIIDPLTTLHYANDLVEIFKSFTPIDRSYLPF